MSGGLHLRKDTIECVERFHELEGDDPNQSQVSVCEIQKKGDNEGKQKSKNNS
jgi:hypothetical protein